MKYKDHDYEYIETSDALLAFCEKLGSKSYMAIDTEFLREKTYWPQLCLVQIKSDECLACIDAQTISDLGPLIKLLKSPDIMKVLHSASQDMEIFFWLDKQAPSPVFDTQIAAPLLGHAEQIGYGNLVKAELNVNLEKAHTRADWTRRPLPEKQVFYALDDVIYLEQLYLKMRATLESRNRLAWLDSEFAELSDAAKYNKPARDQWKKLRAAQNMKGHSLAALQGLAEWRELLARESDRPRAWIIKDDVLADIAKQLPDSGNELSHIRGLVARTREKHGKHILDIIENTRNVKPEPLPAYEKKKKVSPEDATMVDLLTALVSVHALQHEINPTQLASKKQLEVCVAERSSKSLSGWRHALIGSQIDDMLAGRLSLTVDAGRATLCNV